MTGLIMSFFKSFAFFWKLGGAVGACAVFRLCNNACYVKMASIETAVWRNEGKIKIPNVLKEINSQEKEVQQNNPSFVFSICQVQGIL